MCSHSLFMPSLLLLTGYVENLRRHVESFPAALPAGVRACTALTNLLLTGPAPVPGGAVGAQLAAEGAHSASVLAAHQALQGCLAEVLAWQAGLLDASSSLQQALDAQPPAASASASALAAAERCRELLSELQADFAAECAVRAAIASSLLPLRCHALAAGAAQLARAPHALARAEEGDREALTLCVAAWAVPAHSSPARSARLLAGLREAAQHAAS